jgi:Ca2+-binding RTX toxin-like protein
MRTFRAITLVSALLLVCIPVASSASATTALRGHDCTITGTSGPDTITGTTGDDVICGLGGRDVIHARSGADTVFGGPGNDTIFGGGGDDVLHGGADRDLVRGLGGDDRVFGDAASDFPLTGDFGSDIVNGGTGNEVCISGFDEVGGNDTVIGGPGIDHYEIDAGDTSDSAEILGFCINE